MNTVSLEHVQAGVTGGFTQADHGRSTRLRQLHPSDRIVFYSPRTAMRAGKPVQQFTALGVIVGDEPYQVSITPEFHPWRLAVEFLPSKPVDIRPLIGRLTFIRRHHAVGFSLSPRPVPRHRDRFQDNRRSNDNR